MLVICFQKTYALKFWLLGVANGLLLSQWSVIHRVLGTGLGGNWLTVESLYVSPDCSGRVSTDSWLPGHKAPSPADSCLHAGPITNIAQLQGTKIVDVTSAPFEVISHRKAQRYEQALNTETPSDSLSLCSSAFCHCEKTPKSNNIDGEKGYSGSWFQRLQSMAMALACHSGRAYGTGNYFLMAAGKQRQRKRPRPHLQGTLSLHWLHLLKVPPLPNGASH